MPGRSGPAACLSDCSVSMCDYYHFNHEFKVHTGGNSDVYGMSQSSTNTVYHLAEIPGPKHTVSHLKGLKFYSP